MNRFSLPAGRGAVLALAPLILAVTASVAPAAAQDFSGVEVSIEHVAGNVHLLKGAGGNIGLSIGDDGILMIDSQFEPLAEKIRAAIAEKAPGKVRYVLNTHWHGDHTGGNAAFGAPGAGASVVAISMSR